MSFEVIRGHWRLKLDSSRRQVETGHVARDTSLDAVNHKLMKKNLLGYTSKKYAILIMILR